MLLTHAVLLQVHSSTAPARSSFCSVVVGLLLVGLYIGSIILLAKHVSDRPGGRACRSSISCLTLPRMQMCQACALLTSPAEMQLAQKHSTMCTLCGVTERFLTFLRHSALLWYGQRTQHHLQTSLFTGMITAAVQDLIGIS